MVLSQNGGDLPELFSKVVHLTRAIHSITRSPFKMVIYTINFALGEPVSGIEFYDRVRFDDLSEITKTLKDFGVEPTDIKVKAGLIKNMYLGIDLSELLTALRRHNLLNDVFEIELDPNNIYVAVAGADTLKEAREKVEKIFDALGIYSTPELFEFHKIRMYKFSAPLKMRR